MEVAKPLSTFTIRRAQPEEWRSALELVFSAEPPAQRAERVGQMLTDPDSALTLAGLWIADAGGQVVGAILAQRQPGRIATIWPARLTEGIAEKAIGRLHAQVIDWLREQGCRAAQALLLLESDFEREQLTRCGYAHVADLSIQAAVLSEGVAATRDALADGLELVAFRPEWRGRLRRIVERTYQGSLDCPLLEGARDIDDVLDGYAANGDGGTSDWFLAAQHAVDMGCLLLARDSRRRTAEIVYMGLVPEARGKGWGREMVSHAVQRAVALKSRRVLLAVDVANTPALNVYEAAGFTTWATRSVCFRRIDPS